MINVRVSLFNLLCVFQKVNDVNTPFMSYTYKFYVIYKRRYRLFHLNAMPKCRMCIFKI